MKNELKSRSVTGASGAIAIAILGLVGYFPGMELYLYYQIIKGPGGAIEVVRNAG